jgi:nucleoside-diphosphate-sugar epimerase
LPIVVARMSSVVGPGAESWLPLAQRIASGRFRLIGDGGNHIDLVALDDLVDGLWLCATTVSVDGRCYVLGGGELHTVRRFVDAIAHSLDAPPPGRGPAAAPYRALVGAASLVFRTTRYHSAFAHQREILVANKSASVAAARADLGYAPRRSVDDATREMISSFVADGRLQRRGVA